ncbi:aminotransferase class I/II-fold pyridoxal phosphate-dependent enzyme [Actinomycetospora sp. NBRC 106378]|uniref:aminotransferase class I/II-fold pyridoxal phosphate-dependent enzyme n=1 Tax=Actinomycetospora sp. NBRC 106378 TaxID=3032208 RepID=UPI0024A2366A|nr:aminotransferase class I/II-fold pyridoxal phosphate-dependent enzyme [Actinomycetospora sp. NBRC 106378]GLZ51903.1 aminotransferase [Actinomycetospora sp. NBRC 106378]
MTAPSAFARLRALLADVAPPDDVVPVALHLGECRLGTPDHLLAPVRDPAAWTSYPPLGGTGPLVAAYRDWLVRRFGGAGAARCAVEPTPGTKQASATLLALAVAAARDRGADRPAVLVPNPFYPTYLAATAAAGARAVLYPASGVPSLAATVRSTPGLAAVVVCHPGSPGGEVHDPDVLRAVAAAAAEVGALLLVDECYVDLAAVDVPGFLSAVEAGPGPYAVLHTLSKRSGAPGLRSGFLAGDVDTVARYAEHNRSCGVSSAAPVCAAAAALWADDVHVTAMRAGLARAWDVADEVLGDLPGYRRPPAGIFLWLRLPGTADDLDVARRLWRDHAVTVMPGRYLTAPGDRGADPGVGRVRLTLAVPTGTLRPALVALRAAVAGARDVRTLADRGAR